MHIWSASAYIDAVLFVYHTSLLLLTRYLMQKRPIPKCPYNTIFHTFVRRRTISRHRVLLSLASVVRLCSIHSRLALHKHEMSRVTFTHCWQSYGCLLCVVPQNVDSTKHNWISLVSTGTEAHIHVLFWNWQSVCATLDSLDARQLRSGHIILNRVENVKRKAECGLVKVVHSWHHLPMLLWMLCIFKDQPC